LPDVDEKYYFIYETDGDFLLVNIYERWRRRRD